MKSILEQLRELFSKALVDAFGEQGRGIDPLIKRSDDEKFGDYQCNVAMGLAKSLAEPPRTVAEKLIEALTQIVSRGPAWFVLQIAGPGFINIRLRPDFLAERVNAIPPASEHDRFGIDPVPATQRDVVVVDYSSPNVAKQMHVGHLRSTIIGDTLARVLEFEGHEVIRQNHVGDWGTQFGIILEECFERGMIPRNPLDPAATTTGELPPWTPDDWENIYRAGHAKMSDPQFAARAREAVTKLQKNELHTRLAWEEVTGSSLQGVLSLYKRLSVFLAFLDIRGESFYNPLLAPIVEELRAALASDDDSRAAPVSGSEIRATCRVDQGAVCIFLEKPDGSPAFKGPQGDPLPLIAQKSDGAYLYASTDLAAAAFRINDFNRHALKFETAPLPDALRSLYDNGGLGASRVLYVVGSPQKLHFEMLFAVIRALGWTRPNNPATGRPVEREVKLEHVMFGSVLGENRKMLRTRTGENVKLADLLDEAEKRARALIDENAAKRAEMGLESLSEDEKIQIAHDVGIGAVKYADLCQNRLSDYVFAWDKMLALQGNTAPYLMYAHARIRSIHRKGATVPSPCQGEGKGWVEKTPAPVLLAAPAELALGKKLLQLPEILESVAQTLLPHLLCEYLYSLASAFMVFYENCPVLQAPDDATRASRLRLCDLTARALRIGLDLLGIKAPERM